MMNRMKVVSFVLLASTLGAGVARADGVGQIMTAKALPEATIQVIDPESGTSGGGSTTDDINLAVGDIILFRFEYTPVPDKIIRGIQGYVTEYIPPNTRVVGFRITDKDGNTLKPRWPGVVNDDCGSGCDNFNAVPACPSGTTNMTSGTLAAVQADTGIFYGDDARLARIPLNAFINLANGTP